MPQTRYQRIRGMTKRMAELETENTRLREIAWGNFTLVRSQAELLAEAADIFEQINLGTMWQRTMDRHLGYPQTLAGGEVGLYGTPAAVAHQKEAYNARTGVQNGLG